MSNWMFEPHYVEIAYRNGDRPYCDGRVVDGVSLPVKFKSWYDANDFLTGRRWIGKLYPYYPRYAELEKRHLTAQIEKERARFERQTAQHQQALRELQEELDALPLMANVDNH